jgi:hypothetical protein
MSTLLLSVTSRHQGDEEPIRIVQDLKTRVMEGETLPGRDGIQLSPVPKSEQEPSIESRAEPVTLSAIALAFVTGGALDGRCAQSAH